MSWSPILNLLATVQEYEVVDQTIGYVGSTGSLPVTITAVESDPTINVQGDRISGYYSEAFNDVIYYRPTGTTPSQDNYVENSYPYVTRWSDLPDIPLQIYHFDVDPTTSKQFDYIAQAGSNQNTYNIVVTRNYTVGRNQLIRNLANAYYEEYIRIEWINSNSKIVPWVNSLGQTVDWESSAWQ